MAFCFCFRRPRVPLERRAHTRPPWPPIPLFIDILTTALSPPVSLVTTTLCIALQLSLTSFPCLLPSPSLVQVQISPSLCSYYTSVSPSICPHYSSLSTVCLAFSGHCTSRASYSDDTSVALSISIRSTDPSPSLFSYYTSVPLPPPSLCSYYSSLSLALSLSGRAG